MNDEYLSPYLRDFHNQKDVFKKMIRCYDDWINTMPEYQTENLRNLTWIDLHILTIDFILWHLAKQGYTLRANNKFLDEKFYIQEEV